MFVFLRINNSFWFCVPHLSVAASLSSAHVGFLNLVVCFAMDGLILCSNFENRSVVIRRQCLEMVWLFALHLLHQAVIPSCKTETTHLYFSVVT